MARFARASVEFKFAPAVELGKALEESEQRYVEHCERGREGRIYRGETLQHTVALRVLCGSRSRDELLGDVRRVIDDDGIVGNGVWMDFTDDRGEARIRAFWEELYSRMQAADRAGVEELMAQTRYDSLRELGMSDEQIPEPVFPEMAVPW